jgi:hypothetical protein
VIAQARWTTADGATVVATWDDDARFRVVRTAGGEAAPDEDLARVLNRECSDSHGLADGRYGVVFLTNLARWHGGDVVDVAPDGPGIPRACD